jgi:hypothetical protein
MRTAMHDKEKKPPLIEAYVDPFEPIMPPKAKPVLLSAAPNIQWFLLSLVILIPLISLMGIITKRKMIDKMRSDVK